MYYSKKINGDIIMSKIIIGFFAVLLFIGCSSQTTAEVAVEPKLALNKSLENLKLNNQMDVPSGIESDTKKVIFAFSKDVGHKCNDFFATQDDTYLSKNKIQFVADVSAAPSIIRSIFIMPGLKDFKHTILVIDEEEISNQYKSEQNTEKIVVVSLNNKVITDIKYLDTIEELSKNIASK